MPLPSFQESADSFVEPWKTLVQFADEGFQKDYFSNFLVTGKHPEDEKFEMNAWSIVGLAPSYPAFLECHLTAGKEKDKPFWVSELRDVCSVLSVPKNPTILLSGIIHNQLGSNKHHIIGMISLQQTKESKKSFGVLWTNPQIDRSIVEEIIRYVLEKRLKT